MWLVCSTKCKETTNTKRKEYGACEQPFLWGERCVTSQKTENSYPPLQFGFQFGLYHIYVVALLSFLRSISLTSLFTNLYPAPCTLLKLFADFIFGIVLTDFIKATKEEKSDWAGGGGGGVRGTDWQTNWLDDWLTDWPTDRTKERKNERTNEQKNERMDGWMKYKQLLIPP